MWVVAPLGSVLLPSPDELTSRPVELPGIVYITSQCSSITDGLCIPVRERERERERERWGGGGE